MLAPINVSRWFATKNAQNNNQSFICFLNFIDMYVSVHENVSVSWVSKNITLSILMVLQK